jgi:hypothetical protein
LRCLEQPAVGRDRVELAVVVVVHPLVLDDQRDVVAAVLVGERQGVSHRVVEDEHPSDTAVDTREPLSFCETSNGVRGHPCMSGTDDDRAPAGEVAHV